METRIHPTRLNPGQDLKRAIQSLVEDNNIRAGWVATCVGSLTQLNLRFANKEKGAREAGFFEIISLSGTVSKNGCHLHLSVGREDGTIIGGHLLDGCIVYTTAEIVIEETAEFIFHREHDGKTGWKELRIEKAAQTP